MVAIVASLSVTACVSNIRTYRITDAASARIAAQKTKGRGVYYALPKTILRVSAPVSQTTNQKGIYQQFTAAFFPHIPASQVIQTDSTSYDFGAVSFETRGVADPKAVFLLQVQGGRFEDTQLGLELGDSGNLVKLDMQVTNKAAEFYLALAQSVAATAAKAMIPAADTANVSVSPSDCMGIDAFCLTLAPVLRPYYARFSPDQRLQLQEWRKEQWAALLRVFAAPSSIDPNSAAVVNFLVASQDYKELLDLVDGKRQMLATAAVGNTPGETYKFHAELRDARINSILEKFFGLKKTKPSFWAGVFDIAPQADTDKVLYNLSSTGGVCGIITDPEVQVITSRPGAACSGTVTALKVNVSRVPGADLVDAVNAFKTGQTLTDAAVNGMFYRLPRLAQVRVAAGAEEKFQAQVQVAQMGTIAYLPTSTGGRKTQYKAELYPASGALKSILIGQEAVLNAGMVQSAQAAVKTLQDAKASRDAALEPPTDLQVLEAEVKAARARRCKDDPLHAQCAVIK